ncbi:hypothetical protein N7497_012215 [Penicillium chrysogenum]|nr:hypothetical protein N7497_012215 [Penicillium chrysogenum]
MAASEAVLSPPLTVSGLGITCLNAHGRLSLLPSMLCVGCACNRRRRPTLSHLLKQRNRRWLPSLVPSFLQIL